MGMAFFDRIEESISRLASAVGFRYRWDDRTRQFIHAGGIMVATPEGKMSRYFYGIQYSPADCEWRWWTLPSTRSGQPVDYVLLFCFHYDATQGKYTLAIVNVLKIAGCLTVLLLAGLLYMLIRNDRRTGHAGSMEGAPACWLTLP